MEFCRAVFYSVNNTVLVQKARDSLTSWANMFLK